ncbi:MAG: hypothetical protein EZS28_039253, partial [Streblomastix strix]
DIIRSMDIKSPVQVHIKLKEVRKHTLEIFIRLIPNLHESDSNLSITRFLCILPLPSKVANVTFQSQQKGVLTTENEEVARQKQTDHQSYSENFAILRESAFNTINNLARAVVDLEEKDDDKEQTNVLSLIIKELFEIILKRAKNIDSRRVHSNMLVYNCAQLAASWNDQLQSQSLQKGSWRTLLAEHFLSEIAHRLNYTPKFGA